MDQCNFISQNHARSFNFYHKQFLCSEQSTFQFNQYNASRFLNFKTKSFQAHFQFNQINWIKLENKSLAYIFGHEIYNAIRKYTITIKFRSHTYTDKRSEIDAFYLFLIETETVNELFGKMTTACEYPDSSLCMRESCHCVCVH